MRLRFITTKYVDDLILLVSLIPVEITIRIAGMRICARPVQQGAGAGNSSSLLDEN